MHTDPATLDRDVRIKEPDMSTFKIEASKALDVLELAIGRLEKLDGTIASDPSGGSKNSSYNARISKELLFIAHLCQKAAVAVMDEYHSFKGESGHERLE